MQKARPQRRLLIRASSDLNFARVVQFLSSPSVLKMNLLFVTLLGFVTTVTVYRQLVNYRSLQRTREMRARYMQEQEILQAAVQAKQDAQESDADPGDAVKLPPGTITLDSLLDRVDCTNPESYSDQSLNDTVREFFTTRAILNRTSDCNQYFEIIKTFGMAPILMTENEFPLAFAHTLHKQPALVELFLSLTYRPMDSHCIHVDVKAPEEVHQAIEQIVGCYNHKFTKGNIFVAKYPTPVFWGHISVLDADLICMRQLKDISRATQRWKMFLNPAGTELPLKSINAFRQILYNKKESIIPIQQSINPLRQSNRFKLQRYGPGQFHLWNERISNCTKGPPPFNLTILKGCKNVILTKEFVDFVTEDPLSFELYNWLQDTSVPDEHFYSTIATVRVELVPGAMSRRITQNMNMTQTDEQALHPKGVCFRQSFWGRKPCNGKKIHGVCNFGMGDLAELKKSNCFTANKFNVEVDPMAPLCQYKDVKKKTKMDRWKEWKATEEERKRRIDEYNRKKQEEENRERIRMEEKEKLAQEVEEEEGEVNGERKVKQAEEEAQKQAEEKAADAKVAEKKNDEEKKT